jgi:thymidylate synthase
MNNIDKQYQSLLQNILDNGVRKKTRNGETISVFGRQIRHKMSEGFPLLTTKKMAWKQIVTELLWFLRGDTNIKFLLDYDCHIWDGDAYKRYERANTWESQDTPPMNEFIKRIKEDETFRKTWGELGPIYGRQWRDWNGIDQIQDLINELKTNPDSRRLMVSAWNVSEINKMTLPPCHYGFQCYVRDGKYLSLMWNQRSVDTFLGLPFNIASYALLLEIIAREVNMVPEDLIGNLGDTHLYLNQIEQSKEQIGRTPYELPTLEISEYNWYIHEKVKEHMGEKTFDEKIRSYRPDCFVLKNYEFHPKIYAPLSN